MTICLFNHLPAGTPYRLAQHKKNMTEKQIERVYNFLANPLIVKAQVCEAVLGSRSQTDTSTFSRLTKARKFTPDQLEKIEAVRVMHIREIS